MSDDTFSHDEEQFERGDERGGVALADAEAQYADLFAEVIWDGVITPEKRLQLETAIEMFGLDSGRAKQIEAALTAAHEAAHSTAVIEQREGEEAPPQRNMPSLVPLAAAEDPALQVLQRRITLVEERNEALSGDNDRLADLNLELEELVEQLQNALESTLDELGEVHELLAAREKELRERVVVTPEAPPPPSEDLGPASSVQPLEPVSEEAPIPVSVDLDDSPPPSSEVVSDEAAPNSETLPGQIPEAAKSRTKRRWRSRRALEKSESPDPAELARRTTPTAGAQQRRHDPTAIHSELRDNPQDADLLHLLYDALKRSEDLDRRWCVAHALVHLGQARGPERDLYVKHASPGLVRPSRAINEDEWHELLFHPTEDQLTGVIMAAIAPSVLLGQLTAIRASIAPELLDPDQQVDPDSSTVQAVRCLAWAAAFLGLKVPPLYVCAHYPGIADIVLNPSPSTRLGNQALVGRSSKELAFIAGRHLTWYRKEHLLGRPTRSVRRLEDMFLAALMIGNPGLPMTDEIKQRVEPIAKTIRPLLDRDGVEQLERCFTSFVELGGRTNLSRWYGSVERTAACTGLLMANDLVAAQAILELERDLADTPGMGPHAHPANTVEDQMDELVVFFTAGRCSLLRKRIGIAIKGG
jgi:hypothetical protein